MKIYSQVLFKNIKEKVVINMSEKKLCNLLKDLQSPKYKWVDLTHEFGEDTPRWPGFKPLGNKILFDFDNAPMKVNEFTFPGQ